MAYNWIRQVSSAISLGVEDVQLAMSLKCSVNKRGRKTEPCGTPQMMYIL